jgi:hypothetical protein
MLMAARAVVSALFIVGINAIAQRNASLGGWIASVPLVTVLAVGWLAVDQRGAAEIAKFLDGGPLGARPHGISACCYHRPLGPWHFPTRGVCDRACDVDRLFLRGKAVRSPGGMIPDVC